MSAEEESMGSSPPSVSPPFSSSSDTATRVANFTNSGGPCYVCQKHGHFARNCPQKQNPTPQRNPRSSPKHTADSQIPLMQCPCGAGTCLVFTSRTCKNPNRKFYSCPAAREQKCKYFLWCDTVKKDEVGSVQPSDYPVCDCGAGICPIYTENTGPHVGRKFFVCPVKKGHGACNFFRWEDEIRMNTVISEAESTSAAKCTTRSYSSREDNSSNASFECPDSVRNSSEVLTKERENRSEFSPVESNHRIGNRADGNGSFFPSSHGARCAWCTRNGCSIKGTSLRMEESSSNTSFEYPDKAADISEVKVLLTDSIQFKNSLKRSRVESNHQIGIGADGNGSYLRNSRGARCSWCTRNDSSIKSTSSSKEESSSNTSFECPDKAANISEVKVLLTDSTECKNSLKRSPVESNHQIGNGADDNGSSLPNYPGAKRTRNVCSIKSSSSSKEENSSNTSFECPYMAAETSEVGVLLTDSIECKSNLRLSPVESKHQIGNGADDNGSSLRDFCGARCTSCTRFGNSINSSYSSKENNSTNANFACPDKAEDGCEADLLLTESPQSENELKPGRLEFNQQIEIGANQNGCSLRNSSKANATIWRLSGCNEALLLGDCALGWWGRLAFPPCRSLTQLPARPFYCCIFPSFDPICVPQLVSAIDVQGSVRLPQEPLSLKSRDQSLFNGSKDDQASSGVVEETAGVKNSTGTVLGNPMTVSISEAFGQAAMQVRNELIALLESMNPLDSEGMKREAASAFAALDCLRIDYRPFKESVMRYIHASSAAEVQQSSWDSNSTKELLDWCFYERVQLDNLAGIHAEATAAVTALKESLRSLRGDASHLRSVLVEFEKRLTNCEARTVDIETHLLQMSRDMVEPNEILQALTEEAAEALKKRKELEEEKIAAKEALAKAREVRLLRR